MDTAGTEAGKGTGFTGAMAWGAGQWPHWPPHICGCPWTRGLVSPSRVASWVKQVPGVSFWSWYLVTVGFVLSRQVSDWMEVCQSWPQWRFPDQFVVCCQKHCQRVQQPGMGPGSNPAPISRGLVLSGGCRWAEPRGLMCPGCSLGCGNFTDFRVFWSSPSLHHHGIIPSAGASIIREELLPNPW